MPIYDANSDFARTRDQVKAEIEAERQAKRDQELRDAVDREPDRFLTTEQFLRAARHLAN